MVGISVIEIYKAKHPPKQDVDIIDDGEEYDIQSFFNEKNISEGGENVEKENT